MLAISINSSVPLACGAGRNSQSIRALPQAVVINVELVVHLLAFVYVVAVRYSVHQSDNVVFLTHRHCELGVTGRRIGLRCWPYQSIRAFRWPAVLAIQVDGSVAMACGVGHTTESIGA